MGNIFGFGDSYTQGHKLDTSFPSYKLWKQYLNDKLPDTWIEILGDKLNMDIHNYGMGGASNVEIFHTFCKHINEMKKDDIVIINWTFMHRFRWASYDERDGVINKFWMGLSCNPENGKYISESTREEIVLNREHPYYLDEINDYEILIDKLSSLIGFEVYYWSSIPELIYTLPNDKKLTRKYILSDIVLFEGNHVLNGIGGPFFKMIKNYGGKTIFEETDGFVPDNHLGASGHRVQSELFYEYIIDKNRNK